MEEKKQKTIEEYEIKQKKDRRDKIILIIIIILLLLISLVGNRVGKIGYQQTATTPTDSIDLIKVTDQDIEITKDTKIAIFKNEKYKGEEKIAPGSKGEYKFCIENVTEENIKYNIKFADEMKYAINMKYKLKIDNVYIKGDKETYVDIEEISVEDIIVLKDSINVFTIEWYWEDDDINDTIVGSQKTEEKYTLKMEIKSEVYNEQR